ncbi:MAG: GNAT family N-acetyltransferase [Bdellovibrionota bacterium]
MIRRLDINCSAEFQKVYKVIVQLRPHLTEERCSELLGEMLKESYELWALEEDGSIKGLVGFRVYTDFVRGAHIYVDDLVVDKEARSQGIGARLLEFVAQEARLRNFPSLRLGCA